MTIRKSKNMKKANNQKSLDWAMGLTFLMALTTVLELRGANIRIVMVTGDNILITVSRARDCGMVSQGRTPSGARQRWAEGSHAWVG